MTCRPMPSGAFSLTETAWAGGQAQMRARRSPAMAAGMRMEQSCGADRDGPAEVYYATTSI